MNRFGWMVLLVLLAMGLGASAPAPEAKDMTAQQKLNYTLGYVICQQLQRRAIEIDPQAISQGFHAALDEQPPILSIEEMRHALESVVKQQHARAPENTFAPAPGNDSGNAPAPEDASGGAPAKLPTRVIVSDPYIHADEQGFNLRINTQIDAAVPATRRNTLEGDNPNLIR